ncbi:MAG: right-handed parallel beta-helix repeat-containing protein, partial [Anaerolineales bacterium]|nr:right-handed parallel beta-helix repeat-containing protein [Anaerolineales bacterium]
MDHTVAAYWNFNEGSGSTVVDNSFNSNNGTVYGAAWSDSVFTVDADGILNVPDEYSTIQSAINSAIDGQTVQVAAGTYVENINFNGKNISVIGGDQATTIIDGDSSEAVVMFHNGETRSALLKNFTITNGNASNNSVAMGNGGGGIHIKYSSPTLKDLIVANNVASDYGAGIAISNNSNPLLDNITISENSASRGGGLSVFIDANAVIQNAIISNNAATGSGGGVYIENQSSPTFENVQITDNTSGSSGAGVYMYNHCNPIFENVQITGNTSSNVGGGVYISYYTNPIMNNMVISNNSAISADGGGIWLASNPSTSLSISSSTISNNSASSGGGIGTYGNPISVSHSTISGNTASGSGGGLYAVGSNNVQIDHVEITDNNANQGGGLYLQSTLTSLDHLTMANNTASSEGGGLKMCCSNTINVESSIFYNNSPQEIQFSDSDGGQGGFFNVYYSNISGGEAAVIMPWENDSLFWGPGNIDVDPFFANTANGDYSLLAGSQCIDAGNPNADGDNLTWETDYDDRDPDMTRPDMGAYFFNQDEASVPTYALSFDGQDDYARVNSDLYGNLTEATFAWYVKTGNSSTDLVLLGLDNWVNDAVRGFFLAYTEGAPNLQMGTSTQENSFHIFNGGNN